jgi:hypothetical protein
MPIKPNKGEREKDFISRCIETEVGTYGKETEVATAICYSVWRRDKLEKASGMEKIQEKLSFARDFKGINLQAEGLEDACWPGWTAVGTKELDGKTVPNCVPDPNEELEVQPQISSTYPGQGPTTASLEVEEGELNVFGYNSKNFDICPGAVQLFIHLMEMPMEDDTVGMIRSAAQIADNVFHLEKLVIQKKSVSPLELEEAILLVDDFKDVMEEIDEEVGMRHDVSFMDGHIEVIKSYM